MRIDFVKLEKAGWGVELGEDHLDIYPKKPNELLFGKMCELIGEETNLMLREVEQIADNTIVEIQKVEIMKLL